MQLLSIHNSDGVSVLYIIPDSMQKYFPVYIKHLLYIRSFLGTFFKNYFDEVNLKFNKS